jgi:hypothetical protein
VKVLEIIEKLNGEHSIQSLSKEVQISEKKLRETLKNIGAIYDNSEKEWKFEGEENTLDIDINSYVPKRTNKNSTAKASESKNSDFTDDEIRVLKDIIQERKRGYELFSEYRIYDELSKVPTGTETIRNAYNMSKTTTERLKKYSNERRLPLQDLVELAVINLLDKYDK